jgi:hypothetical protein
MVLRNGEHRDAERVGKQDELLALVVGDVAGGGEELDAFEPLRLGEVVLLHEFVQMAHQRGEDLLQARVGAGLEATDDRLGDVVLGDIAHLGETPVVRGARERPRAW